ncbi:ATP-binding protein [Pedobacter jamesrossensis]|uniref:histidine kinase n=1 Tax=Pedobacter jamesrossensis TaxID=1908238 RepID=A0ABV8NNT8_9SPHI
MDIPEKLTTRTFIILIIAVFLTGTLILVALQYSASRNTNVLVAGNRLMINELENSNRLRDIERDMIWVESRIRGAIATDDPSHLQGVDQKVSAINASLNALKGSRNIRADLSRISRLAKLAYNKKSIKEELVKEYERTGKMNNLSSLTNPHARRVSNEISGLISEIYSQRQKNLILLARANRERVQESKAIGMWMVILLVVSGSGCCWFIVARTLSREQLISRLNLSERKATEAMVAKENFMANMSHEIRTPLNAILGFTNLLAREELSNLAKEFVSSIQLAGEDLLTLVNDILDLSKIQAGMIRIEKNPFSVRGLSSSLATLFQSGLKEKKLSLNIEIDPEVPDILLGDATRFTQILVNLIGNAIKFTERGGIQVLITSRKQHEDSVRLNVDISDTGIGIEEDKLALIFERFSQAEDSTSRNYGGTGLGLSIVKDLVELQDGEVWARSVYGQGATFSFFIPYQLAPEKAEINSVPVSELNHYIRGNPKLLVIDDNEMNRSLMSHLLSGWGLGFDMAEDAMSGIAMMDENDYDLVLMDIQMPGMDGYQATSFIRKQLCSNIPIVAMTAHSLAGEREKCLSFGMNEYISKPINERQLYGFIKRFSMEKIASDSQGIILEEILSQPREIPFGYMMIDLGYMKEISKGNLAYEKKVTAQFLELVPIAIGELYAAFGNGEREYLATIVHEMRSALYIMGMGGRTINLLDTLEFSQDEEEIRLSVELLDHLCQLALMEAGHFHRGLG